MRFTLSSIWPHAANSRKNCARRLAPDRTGTFPLLKLLVITICLFASTNTAQAQVKEVISRGGIRAWLIEDHSLPLITMRFSFEGGAALDPTGKEGLTTLLASLLDEGAGELDSAEFQSALAERSIYLSFSAEEDAIYGRLSTLTREKENAFALLRLALHEPRFDESAIERMRDALIAARQYNLSSPNWLASRGFEKTALASHPYGRPADGTVTSLYNIERDDLVAAAPQHLVRNRLKIAVVGDITPERLAIHLDHLFYDLPDGAESIRLPKLEVGAQGDITLIEKEIPQTVLLAGLPGIRRDDPDWFAALAMNYILGGGFQSRLMKEIRVERGLTYGISTALVPYSAGGILFTMASTDNSKTAELLKELRAQMARMAKDGVTKEELAEAKTYLTGAFALRFASSSQIASVLLEVQRLDLTPAYLANRSRLINNVTQADIARVAEKLLKPDKLSIVTVGKPQGITPTQTLELTP